jgi:hypothetical protein
MADSSMDESDDHYGFNQKKGKNHRIIHFTYEAKQLEITAINNQVFYLYLPINCKRTRMYSRTPLMYIFIIGIL